MAMSKASLNGRALEMTVASKLRVSRVCPHCGHPPDDFIDEETSVTDRTPSGGLAVLDGGKRGEDEDHCLSRSATAWMACSGSHPRTRLTTARIDDNER
jgi:hypothetical protein